MQTDHGLARLTSPVYLDGLEHAGTDRRAVLLDHLDQLEAMIVERYRHDSAALEDVALRGTDHR